MCFIGLPHSAIAADDEYLVVWHDYRNGTSDPDVYAQRVSGAGVLVGENITVTGAPYRQTGPYVAYATGGGVYLVAWRDYPGAADAEYDVCAHVISRTGVLVGAPISITDRTGGEFPTDVVYNSDSDQFLALWADNRAGAWNVWGRHVSVTGTTYTETQITSSNDEAELEAVGAYDPGDDQYLVVVATTNT